MFILEIYDIDIILGLSRSCSRFPKTLPAISQKVAQKLLKRKGQKLPFATKVALLPHLVWCK